MAHILAISSQVASGHVGLSAVMPALHALGHQVTALPTIVLSNHPGHARCAGFRTEPDKLMEMLEALAANDRLGGIDAILTGYLPTPAHVEFACRAVNTTRSLSRSARYVCDPILGDDPKGLYIAQETACAIRDQLIPLADVVAPNRFELAWLSDRPVTNLAETVAAARSFATAQTLATSIPCRDGDNNGALATVLIDRHGARATITPALQSVPHGTGDLLAGLYAAEPDLGRVGARVSHVIKQSLGRPELALVVAARSWADLQSLPIVEVQ
jgi:pyridoxine kinase